MLKANLTEEKLLKLYHKNELKLQKQRYLKLYNNFKKSFNKNPEYLFSSPGRTEIAGNHTDHNNGKVIAATINLDTIAAVSKRDDSIVRIISENYEDTIEVNLNDLTKHKDEIHKSSSLIRGIAKALKDLNYKIQGFDAYISSEVKIGSGLSSSASFEILISKIFSALFNNNKIPSVKLALISKYAENEYFKKPCGLMDQLTCAMGGIVKIDFKNSEKPLVNKINFNLEDFGYSLLIIDTGNSHSNLVEDYSSITEEMKSIAKYYESNVLREIDNKFLNDINKIRKLFGDRAFLRAFHFYNENKRVEKLFNTIIKKDFINFLKLVNESGNSSFKYLQNVYSTKNLREQNVSVALALTEYFFLENNIDAACRVHGGGFAGTIQVFIPQKFVDKYKLHIEKNLGDNSVKILHFRNYGAVSFSEL